MKFSLRIILAWCLLVGVGAQAFLNHASKQLVPVINQVSEEGLVDTANLLADLVAADLASVSVDLQDGAGQAGDPVDRQRTLLAAVSRYQARALNAEIWGISKHRAGLIVYLTDSQGRVIFHTDPEETGKDYSRWNDVYLTLRGRYGARTSERVPGDASTSIMYVAAPVRIDGELAGVLSVGQPNSQLLPFLRKAESGLRQQGAVILLIALVTGGLMVFMLTRSIRRLTAYVEDIRQGVRSTPPVLPERELSSLAESMARMREEIEGKKYVESYIHSLTHEMKSPLAAIHGAAELLEDTGMRPEERHRFLGNISAESERLKQLIDRLLSLAAVEQRQQLENPEAIDLLELVQQEADAKRVQCSSKQLGIAVTAADNDLVIQGEPLLIRQAISNLLDNAIDFCAPAGQIDIQLAKNSNRAEIRIFNPGSPIPDYARPRLLERFYSLPRPDSGRKSTGLGLSFVKEVADLHEGEIELNNREQHGVEAVLSLAVT